MPCPSRLPPLFRPPAEAKDGPPRNLPILGKKRPFLPNLGKILFPALLALFLAAPLPAAGGDAMFSPDKRLRVTGLSPEDNFTLARSLAETAAAVEDALALPYPASVGGPIQLFVQPPDAPDSAPTALQSWQNGRFHQRLLLPHPLRLDPEDLRETLVSLLLSRYAAARLPKDRRTGVPPAVPDWLSSGLAQNVHPDLRVRNAEWLRTEIGTTPPPTLAETVRALSLPSGRWRRKAYAAAAVRFLFPDRDAPLWTALLDRLAAGAPLTPEWLRANCPALAGGKVEARWQDFLRARAETASIVPGTASADLDTEERLLSLLTFSPARLVPDLPPGFPSEMYAADLVDHRAAPCTPSIANQLAMQLRVLAASASPELQPVLAAYLRYFEALRVPPAPPARWWRRQTPAQRNAPKDDETWRITLSQLWRQADSLHRDYLRAAAARTRYVDLFDRATASASPLVNPLPPDAPRTPIQLYIDAFDR